MDISKRVRWLIVSDPTATPLIVLYSLASGWETDESLEDAARRETLEVNVVTFI